MIVSSFSPSVCTGSFPSKRSSCAHNAVYSEARMKYMIEAGTLACVRFSSVDVGGVDGNGDNINNWSVASSFLLVKREHDSWEQIYKGVSIRKNQRSAWMILSQYDLTRLRVDSTNLQPHDVSRNKTTVDINLLLSRNSLSKSFTKNAAWSLMI